MIRLGERGFDPIDVWKVVKNSPKPILVTTPKGSTYHYLCGGNTIVVGASGRNTGKVVSAFGSGKYGAMSPMK